MNMFFFCLIFFGKSYAAGGREAVYGGAYWDFYPDKLTHTMVGWSGKSDYQTAENAVQKLLNESDDQINWESVIYNQVPGTKYLVTQFAKHNKGLYLRVLHNQSLYRIRYDTILSNQSIDPKSKSFLKDFLRASGYLNIENLEDLIDDGVQNIRAIQPKCDILYDNFLHIPFRPHSQDTTTWFGDNICKGPEIKTQEHNVGYAIYLPKTSIKAVWFNFYGGHNGDDEKISTQSTLYHITDVRRALVNKGVAMIQLRLSDETKPFRKHQSEYEEEEVNQILKDLEFIIEKFSKKEEQLEHSTFQKQLSAIKAAPKFLGGCSYGGLNTLRAATATSLKLNNYLNGYIAVAAPTYNVYKRKDLYNYNPYKFVKHLERPVLLLHGIVDEIVNVSHLLYFYDAVIEANKRDKIFLHTERNAGHDVFSFGTDIFYKFMMQVIDEKPITNQYPLNEWHYTKARVYTEGGGIGSEGLINKGLDIFEHSEQYFHGDRAYQLRIKSITSGGEARKSWELYKPIIYITFIKNFFKEHKKIDYTILTEDEKKITKSIWSPHMYSLYTPESNKYLETYAWIVFKNDQRFIKSDISSFHGLFHSIRLKISFGATEVAQAFKNTLVQKC